MLGSRLPRHECGELAFQRLDGAAAPAVGDGLSRWIGEDFVFALLQAVVDACRRGFRRSLRNLKAAAHFRIDRAEDNGVDRHPISRQQRPQRLTHVESGSLRYRVARYERDRGEPCHRQIVDDGSLGAFQFRQEGVDHFERTKEVDRQVLFDHVEIRQIVVDRNASIVDKDVESVNLYDGLLNL